MHGQGIHHTAHSGVIVILGIHNQQINLMRVDQAMVFRQRMTKLHMRDDFRWLRVGFFQYGDGGVCEAVRA